MPLPPWRHQGALPPDAPEAQRDIWALAARLQTRLSELLDEVAGRTAEPSWSATFQDGRSRAQRLARELALEAGQQAEERLAADDLAAAFDAALLEVLGSGHVPSLLVTGYAVLGELGAVPARLLVEVAGPHARPLAAEVAESETHRPLAGVFGATDPTPRDLENLRRLTRHLNGQLFALYQSWRQTFHVLGLDGEWVDETSRDTARQAAEQLGLKFARADLSVFGP